MAGDRAGDLQAHRSSARPGRRGARRPHAAARGRHARCGWPGSRSPTKAAQRCRTCRRPRASARRRSSAEPDRYGRLVAFAFAGDDRNSPCSRRCWSKGKRGSRRASATRPAPRRFWPPSARRAPADRGLWADPNFAPLRAENYARLRAERGHFTIVEGKVLSVRESGSTIYLNFGRRWTRDFSVIILRRNQRIFNAAGLEPKAAARPPYQGARLARTAPRPGHRGRRARADRIRRRHHDATRKRRGNERRHDDRQLMAGAASRSRLCSAACTSGPDDKQVSLRAAAAHAAERGRAGGDADARSSARTRASSRPMAASTTTPSCTSMVERSWSTAWWRRRRSRSRNTR